jgi:hypothetical protein
VTALRITRLSPGNYLVNDRYYIVRVREGALYAHGIAWHWRDGEQVGVGGEWRDTKAEALADLTDYITNHTTTNRRHT